MAKGHERTCTATAKTTGQRCGEYATPGAAVCRFHGGGAPQVQAKARRRLDDMIDPALNRLRDILADGDNRAALRAAENVLDRTGISRRAEVDVDTARQMLLDRLLEITDGDDDE